MKRFLTQSLSLSLFCVWSTVHAFAQDPSPTPTATPGPAPSATVPLARDGKLAELAKTNTDAAQKRAQEIALIFDGDSITYRWLKDGLTTWDARFAPLGAVSFGIPGDRTQHVLWRLANGQVDGLKPKVVFLLIGTNNTDRHKGKQIAEGVEAIVKEYRTRCPDAVIVLQAIFPRGALPTETRRAKIDNANELIAQLADGEKVIFLDIGSKFMNPDGSISPEIMYDYLHLTPKGYEIWADAIQPTIDKYFPKS